MKNYLYTSSKRVMLLIFILATTVYHSFSQGFSPQVQARLQFIIDSFQNNTSFTYVGGMSVAIKSEGLGFWKGATGYAARKIDDHNSHMSGGT